MLNINFATDADKQFYYYQYDTVQSFVSENFYVSEEGSRILLLYFNNTLDYKIPNIYPNINNNNKIQNCEVLNFIDYNFIGCTLRENELQNFDNNNNEENDLVHDILCGQKWDIGISVHQLDKTKYPVIRVTKLILPYSKQLNEDSDLTLIADIESGVSRYTKDEYFLSFIQIRTGRSLFNDVLCCEIPSNLKIKNNIEILCYLCSEEQYSSYDSISLSTFYLPCSDCSPFEVIINENIQSIPNNANYFRGDNIFIISLILLMISLLLS